MKLLLLFIIIIINIINVSLVTLGLNDKYWNWVIDIIWQFYLMPLDIIHKETKLKSITYHGFQGTCTYPSLICICKKKNHHKSSITYFKNSQ